MNHDLNFVQDKTRNVVTVQLLTKGQVVLTGHVFLGDMVAEQYCSLSVQRPHLVEPGMIEALKDAVRAQMANPAAADAAFNAVFSKAA
jgi:hypothetical protein